VALRSCFSNLFLGDLFPMPIDVVMPQMGESITEGTLTRWLKKPGDTIARDEPLFEISTDKVDAEIPSPAAGTLGEIKVQEGATVTVNTVVATINEGGGAAAASAPAAAPADLKEDTVTPAAEATAARDEAVAGGASVPVNQVSEPGTEVLMPQMGESITEGTLTRWLKKIGDTVARDEPIFEISTDKVDAEIPSPAAGTLTEIKVQEGQTVTVNTVGAVIGGGAGAPAKTAAAGAPQSASPHTKETADVPQLAKPAPVASAAASAGEAPRSSPLVRKIAKENNVDLGAVPGTGAAGRIT
jgi:pyruvate dehydrogenase E2 component (dihydrolipoamide acetyltransferase)